jgi:NADH:ubiquinone oxidoreductase subunit F (NADH-binding)/(2Fe-2S) ferredoxin/NAD-dependent dihydropyrimidine dehydrogenase PreA subunit
LTKLKSQKEFITLKNKCKNEFQPSDADISVQKVKVLVGMATCGIASGAGIVMNAFEEQVKNQGLTNINIVQTGCMGLCHSEPTVEVIIPGCTPVLYGNVDSEKAKEIVNKHIKNGNIINEWTLEKPFIKADSLKNTPVYKKQLRIALRNCGSINPEKAYEYIASDGYQALACILSDIQPQEVINTIKASGLKGRGGGGFLTGLKWESAKKAQGEIKYVVCNADEGDPGAFMDRAILEGDPHSVIEGMIIAGYSVGASKGYVYIRAEYPLAVARLKSAISQATQLGLLGENILGSGFSFNIDIYFGAGAFVCGEETALLNSIHGMRGEPRVKPPFPSDSGLWGKPTCLDNVETFANVNPIILNGSKWFSSIGTEKSKGTKVFSLAGNVNNVGLVEVPMGTTLREIIFEIGGGIKDGKKFKAAQTGGPSGGCITEQFLDTPIDYDSLLAIGSMMGSGGLIVMDEDSCMVNVAKFYLTFTEEESCGRCTACRIGNKRLREILTKITDGRGEMEDLEKLEELGHIICDSSLCGLGQSSPNPVLSTLKFFRDEYEAHIKDHKCPAGVCTALLNYHVIAEKCTGCTACARVCPTKCISGTVKNPHSINQEKCIKCGSCYKACKFSAIERR